MGLFSYLNFQTMKKQAVINKNVYCKEDWLSCIKYGVSRVTS